LVELNKNIYRRFNDFAQSIAALATGLEP